MTDAGFWSQVAAATDRAEQCGGLEPIETKCRWLDDRGTQFLVRVARGLKRKPTATPLETHSGKPPASNPFLPYDRRMFVADVSPTHVCLLNKFNVVRQHALLVTRRFEHQQTRLTAADFAALGRGLAECDALGFYNSGASAGASQPHRHVQVVPLPLTERGERFPLASAWQSGLPFEHALVTLPAERAVPDSSRITDWATPAHAAYTAALTQLGIEARDDADYSDWIDQPYNLLVTREALLMVPRTVECFESISLNAMALAGTFFVRDDEQFERLRRHGPWTALATVTRPLP